MSEHARDDDLARALEGIPVPEYEPGFWDRLDARLEREGVVPDEVPTAIGAPIVTPAPLLAREVGVEPDLVVPLEPELMPVPSARRERRLSITLLAAAAAVVLGLIAVRVADDDPDGVQIAAEREGGVRLGPDDGTTTTPEADDRDDGGDVADDAEAADRSPSADAKRDFRREDPVAGPGPFEALASTSTTAMRGADGGAEPATVLPSTPQDAFARWAGALKEGDHAAAVSLTGPRTLAYHEALGNDADDAVAALTQQWGRWAAAEGRRIHLIELGTAAGDRVVGLVLERATATGPKTYDAVPLVLGDTGWQVEPAAFDPERDSPIELVSPAPGPSGLDDVARDDDIRVVAAPDGEYYLGLDLTKSTRIPAADAVDGEIRWDPGPQKAGSHLLVVAHVSPREITMLAETFEAA